MNKVVIGIDQSYTRTGFSVLKDKEILYMFGMDFKKSKTNTDKRNEIKDMLQSLLKDEKINNNHTCVCIVVERIRLKTKRSRSEELFLSVDYIKSTGALVAAIIDTAKEFNVPVFSVDTRSWKSAIVGTSKPQENKYGLPAEKYPTILYIKERGLLRYIVEEYKGRGKKGIIKVKKDGEVKRCRVLDDVADSYCIALYGFLPKSKQKLQEEIF